MESGADRGGTGDDADCVPDPDPDPLDLIGARPVRGAFLANMHDLLGRPEWLIEGTGFAGSGEVPETITVRDYLEMMGALATRGPDPGYFIDYLIAGVPYYYGALDQALHYAPNFDAALDLLIRFGSDRPGFQVPRRIVEPGRGGIELVQQARLGAARRVAMEIPLLFLTRLAARYRTQPVPDAVIELRHSPAPYAARLALAAQCEIRHDAPRDALTLPEDLLRKPNVLYDADLWNILSTRCADEAAAAGDQLGLPHLRRLMAEQLARTGRVPRLQEVAQQLGISPRTVIRRLKAVDVTFQALADELLLRHGRILLSDPGLSVARVAEDLGFSDTSGFYRSFRRWTGMTPAEYRRKQDTG
jgi:AraC-like DNA-binding protein